MARVILDPGHYGKYNQSPIVPEYYESNFTWDFTNKLKTALIRRGVSVTLTRTQKNRDIEVTARGKMGKGFDLFVSVHSDASSNKTADFVSAYYQSTEGGDDFAKTSKAFAKHIAPIVNKAMGCKGTEKTASRLSSKDRDNDGFKDDYYGVLRGAAFVGCPAVILEHSFHTNARAAKWLMNETNLAKLAEIEADAICKFFESEDNVSNTTTNDKNEGVKTVNVELNILRKGDKGEQVKTLQRLLLALGYDLKNYGADGSFGGTTEKAVIAFQKANKLTADGIVGAKTWNKLLRG